MISRRHFLYCSGATVMLSGCKSLQDFVSGKRPNLVVVFPDQMRAQAQGFMKMDPVKTPNIDAFAAESHVFTEAISGYPVCSPFRGIMMSGMWATKNGVYTNTHSSENQRGCELPTNVKCWSDVLHENGYDQYYIGKWHLDAPHKPWIPTGNNAGSKKWNEWCPPERRHGFNRWYSYGTYDYHVKPMYWDTNATRNDFKFVEQWGPEHEADKAIEFIKNENGTERDESKPFSLVVSMNPPHPGYELIPQKYFKYYDMYKTYSFDDLANRKNIPDAGTPGGNCFRKFAPYYFAAVTGVDEQFGRIMQSLKEKGLNENTIVVFFSDHGCNLGAHGLQGKNNPYEESLRIPMIFRWEGKIKPTKDAALIEAVDLAPTFLGLLGQKPPAEMQGRDLSEYLLGKKTSVKPVENQLYFYMGKINKGDDVSATEIGEKITTSLPDNFYGLRGIRTKEKTCVFGYKEKNSKLTVTLFNRTKDPLEKNNYALEEPETVNQFKAVLKKRLQEINDPFEKVL